MKQVLRFLALAALLAAPWGGYFNQVQAQQSLPYSYGFENNLATDGWTTSNTSGLNDSEFGISSYASTGSHGFCFSSYDDEGENTQYLISPELSAATGVVVQFYYRASDDYGYETFKVGYSTTDASPSSFTFGSEISTNNTSWTLSEEFNFPAGTKYVAIYYYSDYQYHLYVDDITFTAPASCAKPTALAAGSVTATGATLTWTAGGSETDWTVEHGTAADFTGAASNVSTTPTLALNGLTPATTYYVRVKAVCGVGDESNWSTAASFMTPCVAVASFPWNEDFESATADAVPNCWDNSASTSSTLSSYPERIWGVYSYSGNKMLRMYNYYVSNGTALINTPPITLPSTGDYQFTFDYSHRANCGAFTVKISTDGGTSFTDLQTYASTGSNDYTNPGDFTEATLSLASYMGQTVILQFFSTANYGNGAIFLDNIRVDEAPSCLKPTDVTCSATTTTTATLGWTETGAATAWQICLDGDEANPIDAATNPFTLTGLTSATTYTVKVRANCGANGYSDWSSSPVSVTTKCEAVTAFPWSDDFESYSANSSYSYSSTYALNNPCWVNEHVSGSGAYLFEVSTYNTTGNNTKQLRLPDMSSGTLTKLVLPEMTLPNANYQFVIDVYRNEGGSSYTTEGVKVYASTDGEIADATELGFLYRNYTQTDGGVVTAEASSGWYTYEFPINFSGTCYIILRGESQYGSATYMDNFVVEQIPACKKPTALTCTDYTATTATFSWTPNGTNQTAWQLYISESNSAPADDIDGSLVINANTNPFTVTSGLVAEHTYYAWVRGNCTASSEGYSEWSDAIEFMPSQYKNFTYQENASSNTSYVPFYGYYASNTTNKGQILIPASNFPAEMGDATVRRLTFYTTNSYANVDWGTAEFDVLVAEVPATSFESAAFFDWNEMTTVYSGTLSVSNQEMVINLDAPFTYTGGNLLIGFDLTTTGTSASVSWVATYGSTNLGAYQYGTSSVSRTYYQPKITFNYLPSATPRPTNVHPTEELSTEATVAWTAPYGGNATGYEYQYKIATEEVWSAAATTAGLNVTVTGLTSEKTYDFRVRAIYAGPAYSGYATTQFTTPAACPIPDGLAASNLTMNTADLEWNASVEVANYTVQYRTAAGVQALFEEGFEDATEFAENWTLNNCVSGTNRNTSAKQTGDYGFYFAYNGYSSGITPPQYLISSDLSAYTTNDVTLTFYYKKGGSYTETFKVGWSSTTNDPAEFTWDIEITATSSWENYSHTIPAGTKYISIAYTADDQLSLYIDDLVIGNTLAAGSWNTATATAPNTGEYQLMGLTAGTKYDVRVYAECAADPETENDMITITTLANGNKVFTNAGGDGLWGTNANWVPAGAPTITDNAILRANATIPNGTVATAKKITFEGSPLPTLTLADGGQLISNTSANIIVQKNATANSWMGISTPSVTSYGSTNIKDGTYDLLQYNESTSTWASQKSVSYMTKGRGYIYRRANAATLTFTGATNVGNQNSYAISYAAADAGLKGFNLIGNPYPHNIYYGAAIPTDHLAVGFYTLQPDGTWQATSASTPILVGQAILVKASEAINPFTMTDIATAPGAKAAPASTIAFTVSNDEFTDIAYARFSSEEGLPKISHLNPEAPMLSIDGYAIANLNEGTESFPMSFSGQGSYTLTVSGNTDVTGYLHLVDRLTGRDIDLLSTPSYSFTGSPVSDRFTVKLTPDANEGLSTTRFAIFDGNSLVINGEGTLEVYDVMGRRLMSAEVTGSEYRIPGSDLHTGVYVLRMNGNSQKIVIK